MAGIKDILKPTEEEKGRDDIIRNFLKEAEMHEQDSIQILKVAQSYNKTSQVSHAKMTYHGIDALSEAMNSLQKQNKAMLEMIKELYRRL
ncbi:hypothetical protein JW756_03860 [Candidatus Woesearchaeota archaeon]|nr:hypothetical protein [Candidatus Woesearchaeota archaeon]